MKPLVSVLIPYYNDQKYLSDAIHSVLNQTYENFELILINHACTDSSRTIAHSIKDTRIVHIDLPTNNLAGGSLIFDTFVQKAQGYYLKLFCADDLLVNNALELLVNHMQTNKDVDVVFGNMQYIDQNSVLQEQTRFESNNKKLSYRIKSTLTKENREEILKQLSTGNTPFSYPTVLFKKAITKKLLLNPTLIYLFDVQLWANFAINSCCIDVINDIVSYYRLHTDQMTSNSSYVASTHFEHLLYIPLFFEIKNKELIATMCHDSQYKEKINSIDESLLPFIICHWYLFSSKLYTDRLISFIKISEMLADKNMRDKIETNFNFTIRDLRKLYLQEGFAKTFIPFDDTSISFKRLVFLLLRKVFKPFLPMMRKLRIIKLIKILFKKSKEVAQ